MGVVKWCDIGRLRLDALINQMPAYNELFSHSIRSASLGALLHGCACLGAIECSIDGPPEAECYNLEARALISAQALQLLAGPYIPRSDCTAGCQTEKRAVHSTLMRRLIEFMPSCV